MRSSRLANMSQHLTVEIFNYYEDTQAITSNMAVSLFAFHALVTLFRLLHFLSTTLFKHLYGKSIAPFVFSNPVLQFSFLLINVLPFSTFSNTGTLLRFK